MTERDSRPAYERSSGSERDSRPAYERSSGSEPPAPDQVFVAYRPNRRRRRVVLVAVVVTAVLLATVYLVRSTVTSPAAVVAGYFAALADRNPAAALRLLAPEVAPAQRDLIDGTVLRSPGYAPPQEVSVGDVEVTGTAAVVAVVLTVADRQHPLRLRLRRVGGLVDTVFHRWRLVDGLGTIALGEVPDEVSVGGRSMPAYDARGPRLLPALPGVYQVAVPAGDPLWQERTATARVVPQQAADVDLGLQPQPEVRQEVSRRIVALLDDCAASTELVPSGCPFGYRAVLAADGVQWRIDRYPSLGMSAGRERDETVIVVHTSRDGEATVTYTAGLAGRRDQRVSFSVSGAASLRAGSVSFRPGW